jgi:hypothetical protein
MVYNRENENGNSDGLSGMFSETEPGGATVNALTEEAENAGMIPDNGELGDTERKRRGEDELETACTDFSYKEKLEILKEIHDSPVGGHAGMNRTYRKLKQFINWQGMKSTVKKYIRKCEKCQKNRMMQFLTKMPLMITETPTTIYEKCNIDIMGPFCPSGSQHRYILTVQDDLSKFLLALPLEDKTAEQVAETFVDHFVLACGIP